MKVELIISLEFVEEFYRTFDSKNKYHKDLHDFFQFCNDPIIYTDFEITKDVQTKYSFIDHLLNNNSDKAYQSFKTIKDAIRFSIGNVHNTFKLYFLGENINRIHNIRNEKGFEAISVNNLDLIWAQHYYDSRQRPTSFPVTKDQNIDPRFESWDDLNSFLTPVNYLIISDPYVLKEKEHIKKNIASLLNKYLDAPDRNHPLEIIFCTTDGREALSEDQWSERFNELINTLHLTEKDSLYLFRYPNNIPDHRRGIFTNYWYIYSGNSFQFFNKNGIIKDVKDNIIFYHLFYRTNKGIYAAGINDIKNFIKGSVENDNFLNMKRVFRRGGCLGLSNFELGLTQMH